MSYTVDGMIKLYARYPKRGPQWVTNLNLKYFEQLQPVGTVVHEEHILYDTDDEEEDNILQTGDRVLKIGHLRLSTVLNATIQERSLMPEIRSAKKMVLQNPTTGNIYEVDIAHRLDGPPRPYVGVVVKMRQFYKSPYLPWMLVREN